MLECYKLAVAVLPYLKLHKRIEQFIRLITEIEKHTRNMIRTPTIQIPLTTGRRKSALIRILKEQQQRLNQIEKVKTEYPYIQELIKP